MNIGYSPNHIGSTNRIDVRSVRAVVVVITTDAMVQLSETTGNGMLNDALHKPASALCVVSADMLMPVLHCH
jgi:hypothetical protein